MKRLFTVACVLLTLLPCAGLTGAEPPAGGVTFRVCDVPQATALLTTTDYRTAVERRIGTFEAASHSDRRMVPTHANGLLEATYRAFSSHYPLVLTPDVIWLAICQGFAMHVDANAEALRYRVVAHEGKQVIRIERPDFRKGDPNNPWEEVFPAFCDSMKRYLVADLHSVLLPTFSTTSIVEKAAFEVTFMDALDSYFAYDVVISCGVPSITLAGTTQDWELIRKNAEELRRFDLDWWIDGLLPVLDQFVAASRGNVDRDFWGRIYNRKNMSGEPRVSGWILRFFPYLPGKSGPPTRNPFIQRDPGPTEGIELDDFATGISKAKFRLIDLVSSPPDTFAMEFLAGFVGIFQDTGTLALRPEIGWIVRDDPEVATR
jgi:hypothetical protein